MRGGDTRYAVEVTVCCVCVCVCVCVFCVCDIGVSGWTSNGALNKWATVQDTNHDDMY